MKPPDLVSLPVKAGLKKLQSLLTARTRPPYFVPGFWTCLGNALGAPAADDRLLIACLKVIERDFREIGGSWPELIPGLSVAALHKTAAVSSKAVGFLSRIIGQSLATERALRLLEKGGLARANHDQLLEALTRTPTAKIEKRLAKLLARPGEAAHAGTLAKNRLLTPPEMVAVLEQGTTVWHRGEEQAGVRKTHRDWIDFPSGSLVWFALNPYAIRKKPIRVPPGRAKLSIRQVHGSSLSKNYALALGHVTFGIPAVRWTRQQLKGGSALSLASEELFDHLAKGPAANRLGPLCDWTGRLSKLAASKVYKEGKLVVFPFFDSDHPPATLHTGLDASGRAVELIVENCF